MNVASPAALPYFLAMTTKKKSVDDLRREAAALVAEGKMPSLEAVLKAVAESREKYADKIKAARTGE